MFRKSKPSEMSIKNFGNGSIIEGSGSSERFLVVSWHDEIKLLDLNNFKLSDGSVKVEDINFISLDEATAIADLTKLNYTRSDFTFDPKGMKQKV